MNSKSNIFRRGHNWLKEKSRHFLRTDKGLAAIETAFLFPVFLMMFLASVDALYYFRASRILLLRANTAVDLLAQGYSSVTMAQMDRIFDASDLAGNIPENSGITVQVFVKYTSMAEELFNYSTNMVCPSPIPIQKIDSYVNDGGNAVVASACMNWEPVLGSIFGQNTFSIEEFAIRRANVTSELTCTDCPSAF